MNKLESNIVTLCEWLKSNEIEAIIAELQMVADRKYSEEETEREIQENII